MINANNRRSGTRSFCFSLLSILLLTGSTVRLKKMHKSSNEHPRHRPPTTWFLRPPSPTYYLILASAYYRNFRFMRPLSTSNHTRAWVLPAPGAAQATQNFFKRPILSRQLAFKIRREAKKSDEKCPKNDFKRRNLLRDGQGKCSSIYFVLLGNWFYLEMGRENAPAFCSGLVLLRDG